MRYEYHWSDFPPQAVICLPPEPFDLSFICQDCHHVVIVDSREVIGECHASVSAYIAKIHREDGDYD